MKCLKALAVLLIAMVLSARAALSETPVVAKLYLAEGEVFVRPTGTFSWNKIEVGTTLSVGDTVRTGDDGKAALEFVDGALVRLGRLSAMTFNEVSPTGTPAVMQHNGKAYFFSRGARKEPSIHTPVVNAAIYGTELVVNVTSDKTTIDVLHGSIKASNELGSESVGVGESVTARRGSRLTKTILVRPQDAVQWMIRFPFILTPVDLAPSADTSCNDHCTLEAQTAITTASRGGSLFESIRKAPQSLAASPRGKILQAIALWQAGDLASSQAIVTTLPGNLGARDAAIKHILEGFASLQRGDISASKSHAADAAELVPDMVNTALLKSYIAQAQGDVELALTESTALRKAYPQIAETYDREAELLLSSDEREAASEVMATRTSQFGSSPLSSTLAGFSALANKEMETARSYFDTAIKGDPSQSLAYLGNALLDAQSRDYTTAKGNLSRAVQLDPSVAVYRSYLGKLFFEDENSPKAIEEFDAAVALDPNDPTPYLYRSYAKIAENDPVAGLTDVERSIRLNDGRAVYRSSLLLDRDVAVRSAGLARAFSELGFSEAARIEAIKSITDDYSNYSAHRLLSDSYTSILDTEGYNSEQRIADLLAPLSFNLFNSVGEQASLGDYNALFDKKETRKAVGLNWASNQDHYVGNLLATGKGEDYGYLFSYRPDYAFGSHHNAFFGDSKFRGALQYETSPNDRFILDTSWNLRDVEGSQQGDYSEDVHVGSVRLGYNHRVSTNLRFLTQGEFARDSEHTSERVLRDITVAVPEWNDEFSVRSIGDEYTSQRIYRDSLATQAIYTSHYLDSVSGIEGLYADTSRRGTYDLLEIQDVPPFTTSSSSSSGNLSSGTAYEYLSLKVPRRATLTLGVDATHVERDLTEVTPFVDGSGSKGKVSPKFGLVVTPTSWLTGRAAYFEGLRKSVLEDLSSLEPTLVGGINQRFNDFSGTESRNLGFGLDVKDANTLYAGAQYTRRHIIDSLGAVSDSAVWDGESTTPLTPSSYGFEDSHANSDTLRGYVYSVLTPKSVLTADSLYEHYAETDPEIRANTSIDGVINTQRYRFGYKYFLGKHFSVGTQATYRDQQLSQTDDPNGFWLFDLGVNYRFSEQHGRMFARIDNILDRDFTYAQTRGLETQVLEGRSFIVGVNYNFW
jgi:tetratricopeptide (TPR) repeat protein